jgi:ABC-type multidrug transport system fused ATPase/permease subunit
MATPRPPASLGDILRAERAAVGLTYALTLVEIACTLAYPALTGRAVDGLLARSLHGLYALVAVWLLHLVVAFARQRYDTRVFMGINARVASFMIAEQQGKGHGTSAVSARVEMVRDIVDFFETELPSLAHHSVAIVGSLVMLFTYDIDAGAIALAVLLPMALVNAWYWRKALRLNRGIHNQIEREVDAIESRRPFLVRRHFWLMRRWRVKLSDAESWTWALTELCTMAALVWILIDFTASPGFSAGAVYAVIAYVYDYLEGLNHVPALVNSIARLKDVRRRL